MKPYKNENNAQNNTSHNQRGQNIQESIFAGINLRCFLMIACVLKRHIHLVIYENWIYKSVVGGMAYPVLPRPHHVLKNNRMALIPSGPTYLPDSQHNSCTNSAHPSPGLPAWSFLFPRHNTAHAGKSGRSRCPNTRRHTWTGSCHRSLLPQALPSYAHSIVRRTLCQAGMKNEKRGENASFSYCLILFV